MADFLKWLWDWLKECSCRHEWAEVRTYKHKGHGVAVVPCSRCGKHVTYQFWYKEED